MLLELFYIHSRVPEMSSCAPLFAANDANAPFEENFEVPVRALFKLMPLLLDKGFKLRKELFNRIKVW